MASPWRPPVPEGFVVEGPAAWLVIAIVAALAMLGPGAHSIDARLFGRREIVIADGSGRGR